MDHDLDRANRTFTEIINSIYSVREEAHYRTDSLELASSEESLLREDAVALMQESDPEAGVRTVAKDLRLSEGARIFGIPLVIDEGLSEDLIQLKYHGVVLREIRIA